jgi:hypothetical protein
MGSGTREPCLLTTSGRLLPPAPRKGGERLWLQTLPGPVMPSLRDSERELISESPLHISKVMLIYRHISTTNPTHPAPPSEQLAANARQANSTTGSIAESADSGAKKVGQFVHDTAQKSAHYLPESVQRLGDPVPEQDKGELRKLAETGWTQATFAAKGLVGAATTIAGAVSQNAHRAVEHNFGKEADGVAQGRSSMV